MAVTLPCKQARALEALVETLSSLVVLEMLAVMVPVMLLFSLSRSLQQVGGAVAKTSPHRGPFWGVMARPRSRTCPGRTGTGISLCCSPFFLLSALVAG